LFLFLTLHNQTSPAFCGNSGDDGSDAILTHKNFFDSHSIAQVKFFAQGFGELIEF